MKTFDHLVISFNSSLINAAKKMDSERKKLLMVFEDNKFVGLLTIGDIQRAIIQNVPLTTPVNKVLRKDSLVAYENEANDAVKQKMLDIRAEYMPILNEAGAVIDVVFWEELFKESVVPPAKNFNLPVVIMAGGLGTRLRPITNVLPKPLIPIHDKTIIEHIFGNFHKHGCLEFFISVNYKADLIEYYLTEQRLPYRLTYFREEKPMGTAGSLSLLVDKINTTFFVSNCDIMIEQDYSEILQYHQDNNNEITLVAALKNYKIPYGTIESGENGELKRLIEKPDVTFMINSGMYLLEPHLLKEIPNNKFFHITELIEAVRKRNGKVGVFPVTENSWRDIGEWDEYLKNKDQP